MKKPLISIAIICYNSEETIRKTLQSIKQQNYPKSKIEVLVIDGFSTDKTRQIVRKFGYKVIDNLERGFIPGKFLAFQKAKGEYLMYIDSDEEMNSKTSISRKVQCFLENEAVKGIMSTGYVSPEKYPFINQYLSEYGDPFACFIYSISKHPKLFIPQLKQKYGYVSDKKNYTTFSFKKNKELPLIEFVALASMIDLTYMKTLYKKEKTSQIPHFFYKTVNDGKLIAIMKNDTVTHYSSVNVKTFLNKIAWRVKKNVFDQEAAEAGFLGRDNYQTTASKLKKYLFVPYAFSLIWPIYDGLMISHQHENSWKYLIHIPLTIYTAGTICYYYALKILGIEPKDFIYGK